MTVIPPGYAEISHQFIRNGDPDPYYVIFGVRLSGGSLTVANLNNYVTDLDVDLPSVMSNSMTLNAVRARVGQDGGDPVIIDVAADVDGTSAASVLPQNCALLITKLTAAGGRRNKGRMFWPSIAEVSVDQAGQIAAGDLAGFQAQFSAWLNRINTGGTNPNGMDAMVIFHATAPFLPTVVTSLRCESLLSTQRRRLRR